MTAFLVILVGLSFQVINQIESSTSQPKPNLEAFKSSKPQASQHEVQPVSLEINESKLAPAGFEVDASAHQNATPEPLEGRAAIELNMSLLQAGYERLSQIPGYTAKYYQHEMVDGKLLDEQLIDLKIRHQPFSAYFKWLAYDAGKEVIYVKGKHDDRLLVHFGGWKARLLPTLKIAPTSSLAKAESRYPISSAGLMSLIETLIYYREIDLQREDSGVDFQLVGMETFNNSECYRFELVYEAPHFSELYRKSIQLIDKQFQLPVFVKNFAWPTHDKPMSDEELDGETFIEHYTYSDIDMDPQLTDVDFETTNKAYNYRK